jgi:UDP-glucose 4-epimerase
MRILITGVNGLLGKELARLLCKDNECFIFGLSRSEAIIELENYHHIQFDLNNSNFINKLPNQLDVIIHLAQSEKFRDFPSSALEIFNINTISTLKLLDFGRTIGLKKFIYASSGGVYGNKDVGFSEDSPVISTGDLGFYLSSKLCSEILADNYSDFFNVIQLRFFFMYGENQNKNMLIPRLLNSIINKKSIQLTGKGGITINPIYVSDAAKTVEKVLKLDRSDKINIGGIENLSLKQIAEIISSKVNAQPIFEYIDKETKSLIGDIKKMKKELYTPKIMFEKGIEKLINYQNK